MRFVHNIFCFGAELGGQRCRTTNQHRDAEQCRLGQGSFMYARIR